jgi:hypothetical protein
VAELGFLCYNRRMYNWSTDEKNLQQEPERYAIWKLEQLLNFGLNGEKISEVELRIYENKLQLDGARRKLVSLLLHGKASLN